MVRAIAITQIHQSRWNHLLHRASLSIAFSKSTKLNAKNANQANFRVKPRYKIENVSTYFEKAILLCPLAEDACR